MNNMDYFDEDSMDVDEVAPTANETLKQVKLRTSDNKRFTLTKSQASCSNALRRMIDVRPNTISASNEYINLQNVSSLMLTKVIEWCQIHQQSKIQEIEPHLTDGYKEFFKSLPEQELFKLMHVSNYLDIESLFDACCRTTAKQWEGKRVEDLRRMYNIESDFAPEEEHQMLMESKKLGMDN